MSREELTRDKELLKALKSLPIARLNLITKASVFPKHSKEDIIALIGNLPPEVLTQNLTLLGCNEDFIREILTQFNRDYEPEVSNQR